MDEYKTDRSVCFPSDLVTWQENGLLLITPKFQRRSVWRTPARSFFIDTMLRGMTVPPFYFRLTQDEKKTKTIREVVDGQQRVRTILDFIAGEFRLAKTLAKTVSATWAGKKFSELTEDQQQQIMSFSIPAEMFKGISDKQILQVFCRLNMNGVGLNKQELRNGKFFGLFKSTSYEIALSYLQFWRNHKIFSEQSIARMLEVELTSELLIAANKGMQDKKAGIDTFYADWEETYPTQARDEKQFAETMASISETFSSDALAIGEFHRPPLFYTLYCVVFHHTFGLPGIPKVAPRKRLTVNQRESLRDAVGRLSDLINQSKDASFIVPRKYAKFISAGLRQTDNISPRKIRFDTLYDEAFD